MPEYGMKFLSKVIDANDPGAFTRFNVEESHFLTEPERKAFRFIRDYAELNRGQAPDYRTVAAEVEGFDYWPNVEDTYEFLVGRIKSLAAKYQIRDILTEEGTKKLSELDGKEFLEWLISEAERVKMGTDVRIKVGTNLKTDTDYFLEEYKRRKAGESFRVWKSKFPSINREVGGFLSGNMYTWYGRSGRGKSVFTLEEAIEAAMQGANVLIWAMEMSRFEVMARAYSSISAREGILSRTIDGVDYECGFENKALLMGSMTEEYEQGFETFLSTLPEVIPGNIIVRAVDDEDFRRRDVAQLEADIIETKADVVVIDPFYYMTYEANTSKTAGGDAANTSKKLRHLAGRTKTVIHVITQSEEVKNERDADGNRELMPPTRAEIKKTKAVLEDATNTFGIDTLDGRGVIEIGKGRHGGEGVRVEIVYLPNYGIVQEVPIGEDAGADQFVDIF